MSRLTIWTKGLKTLNFKNSESALLWVYRGMPHPTEILERVDLVLTPHLYVMKQESLPVRFSFEAKRIAPSILEERGAGDGWAYEVVREEEGWLFFAYAPQEILQILQEANVPPEKVGQLFFAQQFKEALTTPKLLDNGEALINLEGTVTLVPGDMVDSADTLQTLEMAARPKKGFPLHGAQKRYLPSRTASLVLTLAFALLAIAWMIEGIRYHRAAIDVQRPLEKALKENPKLASGILRHNIYQRDNSLDKVQRRLRETLRKIGKLTSRDSKLSELKISPSEYEATIEAPSSKLRILKNLAKNEGLSVEISGGKLKLKGAWR